jgi:uncharacterized protein YdeI (YjbR/CyaY-like superfamily)
MTEPIFFPSAAKFRAWLERNHASASEVLVGFHKRATGRPTMTWSESVDQALCFGWIDGVRRGLGADAYTIRFTPRRPTSTWSRVNIAKVEALMRQGLMRPAGTAAFEARTAGRSGTYSYEAGAKFSRAERAGFRAHEQAWAWFQAQAPYYRRTAEHWVASAKRPATRASRLQTLIDDSAAGRKIKPLRR